MQAGSRQVVLVVRACSRQIVTGVHSGNSKIVVTQKVGNALQETGRRQALLCFGRQEADGL